jgi:N-acetylglucosaminyl-diphospho-decaprenol L-rhamnosyltransferase
MNLDKNINTNNFVVNTSIIVFSIVSHGQSSLVNSLLDDFRRLKLNEVEIIITLNTFESVNNYNISNLNAIFIINEKPKGFGENHNQALLKSEKQFLFIINPDIRMELFNIANFLESFNDPAVGVVAPKVLNSEGSIEENARNFPTIFNIICKIFKRTKIKIYNEPTRVDWVAGMFVIYRKSVFQLLKGFDQNRFFMYYEDVDICRRLNHLSANYSIILDPRVYVIHDAQRASHKNLRHLFWHLKSAFRYFSKL